MARLATHILSNPHKKSFIQLETLLPKNAYKKVKTGQTEKIENIGKIAITFFVKIAPKKLHFYLKKILCVFALPKVR